MAVALSGCGSPPDYPPNLSFPPRTDRIVLKSPDKQPDMPRDAGNLDGELADLDARGGRTFDPASVLAERRQALDRFLSDAFGTPAAPKIAGDGATNLGLTPERLSDGGRLFRRHCLQCHGLSGDGRGQSGMWMYPHPRDFRRGVFKFVSTDGSKPRRADLLRTLRKGLNGTAMPSFALLQDSERELLAGYVTYLSIRGQVEYQTLVAAYAEDTDDVAAYANERLTLALGEWLKAEASSPPPSPPTGFEDRDGPEHLDSVRRGFELFTNKAGVSCISCHEDFGRKAAYRYDIWGTVVRPAELTLNKRKGGDRPEDQFSRVRGGIPPAGMPAHPSLTDAQTWDVVRFVRSLPYPRELPVDVQEMIYSGR